MQFYKKPTESAEQFAQRVSFCLQRLFGVKEGSYMEPVEKGPGCYQIEQGNDFWLDLDEKGGTIRCRYPNNASDAILERTVKEING